MGGRQGEESSLQEAILEYVWFNREAPVAPLELQTTTWKLAIFPLSLFAILYSSLNTSGHSKAECNSHIGDNSRTFIEVVISVDIAEFHYPEFPNPTHKIKYFQYCPYLLISLNDNSL